MITDPKRLTDGFRGLPDGMDGSRLPPLVPATSVWYSENVSFRDGLGAKTRPVFNEIPPSFWRPTLRGDTGAYEDTLVEDQITVQGWGVTTSASRYDIFVRQAQNFQGTFFYSDPRYGNPAQVVVVANGVIVALNFAQRSCYLLNISSSGVINYLNPSLPVFMCQAERFLIIQNGYDTPQIYDGYVLAPSTAFGDGVNVVPVGKQMAYGQGRLFVANPDGTQITAGDMIYSGSSSAIGISTITPPTFPVTSSISQPATYAVTASISGTTCTLTGTGLPFSAGNIFYIASNDSDDKTNAALGANFFVAVTANSTTITYSVPSGTVAPVGKLVVSQPVATATLTGVGIPLVPGNSFLVTSDSSADQSNASVGVFVAGTPTTGTTITYSVPTGTTVPVGNLTMNYGFPGYVTVTTSTAHGYAADNVVTIQGTTSSAALNGTFVIQSVPSTTSFTIAVDGYAYGFGTGGTVTLANAGKDSDVLNFTETTFLDEGGNLSIPADLGTVVTMNFVPLQDTATGQGDLVVLCTRGAASMAVAVERSLWSQTPGFQRVLYRSIGAVCDSTALVNGDLFFRSLDGNGIRSYRSARAEFTGYGQVPMSAEIDPILGQDTTWLLGNVSFLHHNDRLLMTCWPEQMPAQDGDPNTISTLPIYYTGLAVLDFRSVANGHLSGTAKPAFDGVWTGQNVLKLFGGNDSGVKRAFFFAFNNSSTGTQGISLWEIMESGECDLGTQGPIPITSTVITRAYNFNEQMALKKLIRLDLWLDSIEGGPTRSVTGTVYYRPDDWPTWINWATISKTANTETVAGSYSSYPNLTDGYAPQLRFPAPTYPATGTDATANTMSAKPSTLGYDFNFKLQWTGHARVGRLMLHALEIIEPIGGASL